MSSEEDTVLVTGASGHLATHITQQLLKDGYKVRGTVRSLKNEDKVKPLRNLCSGAKHPLELVEADLTNPESWLGAVKCCTYVIHTASPFPNKDPTHEDELIKPAVEGTLSVLRACQAAGGVKRVVLTSSCGAISYGYTDHQGKVFTEKDWTVLDGPGVGAYIKSKVLAEKAAWDFVEKLPNGEKIELAVINPSFILGPVLCGGLPTSMDIIAKLLNKEMPMLAQVSVGICDVREVARAHIVAMKLPEAAGCRHIIATRELWFAELAQIMAKEFRPQGYKVPTLVAPKFLLRIVALFDPTVRLMLPQVGHKHEYDASRFRNVLGINPRPVEETILDMCYDMIETGKIKKTPQYRPRDQAAEA